jgi:cupin fold WbuC family metalloprotein
MKQIFSKINEGQLLHIVHYFEDIEDDRNDIVPESEFIQLSSLKMNKGKTFRPHKHVFKPGPEACIAQESWTIIKGMVKVMFYDLDDALLEEHVLKAGDCSVTLQGGHNYLILEDDTLVYEYKTGPYHGQKLDKVFLNEKRSN